MELKTVEEYSLLMTRREFDKFTEEEGLCPSNFGLNEIECNDDCKKCYDNALVGIEFKAELPSLPKEKLVILNKLADLEIKAKEIKEQQAKLKANLLEAMENYGVKKWDNEIMTVTYTAPTVRSTVDSKKLLKEYPEIYSEVIKTSKVASSVRIKLK